MHIAPGKQCRHDVVGAAEGQLRDRHHQIAEHGEPDCEGSRRGKRLQARRLRDRQGHDTPQRPLCAVRDSRCDASHERQRTGSGQGRRFEPLRLRDRIGHWRHTDLLQGARLAAGERAETRFAPVHSRDDSQHSIGQHRHRVPRRRPQPAGGDRLCDGNPLDRRSLQNDQRRTRRRDDQRRHGGSHLRDSHCRICEQQGPVDL